MNRGLATAVIRCTKLRSTVGLTTHRVGSYLRSARQLSSQGNGISGQTVQPPVSQRQIKTQCATRKDITFKILSDDLSWSGVRRSALAASNIELDDLELVLGDRKMTFNLTWLRDSCHCSKCTHQHSRQRLLNPKDFKKEMFVVEEVLVCDTLEQIDGCQRTWPSGGQSEGQFLQLRWADGHKSNYALDWLTYVDNLYHESKLNLQTKRTTHVFPEDDFYQATRDNNLYSKSWTVERINSDLEPINYHDLVDSFKFHHESTHINANKLSEMSHERYNAMCSLSRQLVLNGLAKLINVPLERDQVLKIAKSLAYERPTGYGTVFDVVVEPSEEINLAYSSLEFDLHSDLTYRETSPGVQMLHCIANSIDGGLSYFSDTLNAAESLRKTDPELFEVLLQFPVTFIVRDPYRDLKFRRHQPVLSLDYDGRIGDVYYSPFMMPPIGFRKDVKLFYLAFDKFTSILQSQRNKLIAKMEPGDLFIFHNRRVLHGRSSYDATTSNRFLQGCYMDWDEIKCLYEKLHSKKHIR